MPFNKGATKIHTHTLFFLFDFHLQILYDPWKSFDSKKTDFQKEMQLNDESKRYCTLIFMRPHPFGIPTPSGLSTPTTTPKSITTPTPTPTKIVFPIKIVFPMHFKPDGSNLQLPIEGIDRFTDRLGWKVVETTDEFAITNSDVGSINQEVIYYK